MEQILINLVAGALGGVGVGKSSPTFDLGMIGNIISGLIGGGVLGQIVTLLLPAITAAAQSGNLSIGGIINLTGDRRRSWRCHTHGDHWRNQEQSCCLTGSWMMYKLTSHGLASG
jgi:hypothetical protein